jgi:hypothetical protein
LISCMGRAGTVIRMVALLMLIFLISGPFDISPYQMLL